MKLFDKKGEPEERPSILRAALGGAPQEELWKEAVRSLSLLPDIDRVGLWAACTSPSHKPQWAHGWWWDRDLREPPREWSQLSTAAALPKEWQRGLKPIEQILEPRKSSALLGPLIELRRVLWLPVASADQLLAVVLVGSRNARAELPRTDAESIA